MSGYNQDKDQLIKLFEMKKEKASLLCSIFSYNGGEPKLGIIRSYEKKNGETGYGNMGRLTLEEMLFLKENIEEIISTMTQISKI